MSPNFSLNGEATLTVKVAPWGNGKENDLSIWYAPADAESEEELVELYSGALTPNEWNEITLNVTGEGESYIIFDPAKRLFIDDVLINIPKEDDTTGINNAIPRVRTVGGRIYSIDGRYVGLDFEALPHGIYIIDGKKVVK